MRNSVLDRGSATPLFNRAAELYQSCADLGLAEDNDVAVMVDVLSAMQRK